MPCLLVDVISWFQSRPRLPSWSKSIVLNSAHVWTWQAHPHIQPACPSLYNFIKRNNSLGKIWEPMLVCSSVDKVTSRSCFYFPIPNVIYGGELMLRTELLLWDKSKGLSSLLPFPIEQGSKPSQRLPRPFLRRSFIFPSFLNPLSLFNHVARECHYI